MGENPASNPSAALAIVVAQMELAAAAKKCHSCGCFQAALASFEKTSVGRDALRQVLTRGRAASLEKKYDCLGCEVCYAAVAEDAFAQAFPGEAPIAVCTDPPAERHGWPPLPGDYKVRRYRAPIAVCTLNSADVADALAARAAEGLAIVGTLHTENLGIERIVRNVLANPHIRFLITCGEDARQAIGHLPGQSLAALCESGLDGSGRIRGARGKRPILKNVTREQVEAFRRQVAIVSLIGELDVERIEAAVTACATRDPGPFESAPADGSVPVVPASEPRRLVLDPAGFLVIYPVPARGLVLEHYRNDGVLDCMVEGSTSAAVGASAIERGLVSRLDHAVYLGRELARAEESLRTGRPYVQDRAAGTSGEPDLPQSCACSSKT